MSDIAKKPNKLAAAIYLLTNFLIDSEPLKWKLRTLASNIASLGTTLEDKFSNDWEKARFEMRNDIKELRSLSFLARNAGLISHDNHEILDNELKGYLDFIGLPEMVKEEERGVILSKSFLGPEIMNILPSRTNEDNEKKDNLISKEKMSLRQEIPVREQKGQIIQKTEPVQEKKEFLPSIKEFSPITKSLKEFGAVSVKKNSRQSVIINLLKRKREIMIKDVSPLINGCSEKTIQRELLSMVQAGILHKKGEKRWSRYSLA